MKSIIRGLANAFREGFVRSHPEPQHSYVLLLVFPGRRPLVRAYKMGESWYAHEFDVLSDWRVKLLPQGKVESGRVLIEGWEPVSQNMIDFYHSIKEEKKDA